MLRKPIRNGAPIAESDRAVGNRDYFPREAVKREYRAWSPTQTVWPGVASYYTIGVDGEKSKDEARYHPTPKPATSHSGAA